MPTASDVRDILSLPSPSQPGPSTSPSLSAPQPSPSASNAAFNLQQPPFGRYGRTPSQNAVDGSAAAAGGDAQGSGAGGGGHPDSPAQSQGMLQTPEMSHSQINASASGSGIILPSPSNTHSSLNLNHPTPTQSTSRLPSNPQSQPHQNATTASSSRRAQGSKANQTSLTQGEEKIDGLTRELYALIGDNAPSLALVRKELGAGGGGVGGKGKERWRKDLGRKEGVRWHLQSFTPSNRPDSQPSQSLKLSHWRPLAPGQSIVNADDTAIAEQEKFEQFGRADDGGNVMSYSQHEYDTLLADITGNWTAHETNYLFSLLKLYDLRFLIVADRYAYLPPGGKSGQDIFTGTSAWPIANALNGGAGGRKKKSASLSEAARKEKEDLVRRSTRTSVVTGTGSSTGTGRYNRHGTPGASDPHSQREKEKEREREAAAAKTDVKRRSVEECKERYYLICRRLLRSRPAVDEGMKERLLKAYDYDYHREIARKKYANSLFHLTRPQMLEEESLYVSLKRMEQTERRYRSERDELMRVMGGLESGVVAPVPVEEGANLLATGVAAGVGQGQGQGQAAVKGNRAFGRGESLGIGIARAPDGTVLVDKLKKRRRGEDGEPANEPDIVAPPPAKKRADPHFEERNNIYRIPIPANPAQQTAPRALHQPAYLRSTRMPVVKSQWQAKVNTTLAALNVSTTRLIMPTRENVEKLEAAMQAAAGLAEMKRLVDRAEGEVRMLKIQKEGMREGIGGVPLHVGKGGGVTVDVLARNKGKQRSESFSSSATSEIASRKKR